MTDGETASSATHDGDGAVPKRRSLATMSTTFLREPLLHFLILGAALFGVHAYRQRAAAPSPRRITVSAGRIEHLAAIFTRTWQRPPTRQELDGLIDDYVREEVAYREGLSLGLDQDDTIIRRRIRQKLDFFAEDLVSQIEPTEEQLAKFLNEHQDAYRVDPRISFRHVFFDPARHGDDLEQEMAALRDALRADPTKSVEELGDQTLLEPGYRDLSRLDAANLFGEAFAAALVEFEPERWHGPVRSAYGFHLVRVDERRAGRVRPLEEVRDAVRRDWEHHQRKALAEDFYRGLLKKYDVSIERPAAAAKEE